MKNNRRQWISEDTPILLGIKRIIIHATKRFLSILTNLVFVFNVALPARDLRKSETKRKSVKFSPKTSKIFSKGDKIRIGENKPIKTPQRK